MTDNVTSLWRGLPPQCVSELKVWPTTSASPITVRCRHGLMHDDELAHEDPSGKYRWHEPSEPDEEDRPPSRRPVVDVHLPPIAEDAGLTVLRYEQGGGS